MAVLHPQHDLLVGLGSRKPGVIVGRPRVGVVRAGQLVRPVAKNVERVFDDVVADRTDHVDEQLTRELAKAEAPAHLAAVDRDAARSGRRRIAPLRQHRPVGAEQAQPQVHGFGAVTGPVVRGHHARVAAAAIAEEREIGREVQRIEILARVHQHVVGQAHRIQGHDLRPGGDQMADVIDEASRIERQDQNGFDLRRREIADRLRAAAERRRADRAHVLHEQAA